MARTTTRNNLTKLSSNLASAGQLTKDSGKKKKQNDSDTADSLPTASVKNTDKPKKETEAALPASGATQGLQPGWQRFTITTEIELVKKLRDYAYTYRLSMKEAASKALHLLLDEENDLMERP